MVVTSAEWVVNRVLMEGLRVARICEMKIRIALLDLTAFSQSKNLLTILLTGFILSRYELSLDF